MVRLAGLEPAILAFETRCPVKLNDSRIYNYNQGRRGILILNAMPMAFSRSVPSR